MEATNKERYRFVEQGKTKCLFDSSLISHFTSEMLKASYWQSQNAVTGSAQGRGTTWFVRYADKNEQVHDWVLRHYYRGGLIGKFNKDLYCFTGLANTRSAKEFALLQHMQTLGLPAPEPIAYRVDKHGLFYKADLLSSRIANASDLVAQLSAKPLSDNIWRHIGETIKRFHDANIYHHDLNSHNILLSENQAYLIDFDRGELRENSTNAPWKQQNMARLHRSFVKELNQLPIFHFSDENWQTLIKGYNNQ